VDAHEMTSLNETFLRHQGSTDVITFDYAERRRAPGPLEGEIFVCWEEARKQARRFGVMWQTEIVRYIVHGVLHLSGYDDKRPSARAQMKREENRLLRALNKRFAFGALALTRPARTRGKAAAWRK
jgi:rRNA maturation RNase YbeY